MIHISLDRRRKMVQSSLSKPLKLLINFGFLCSLAAVLAGCGDDSSTDPDAENAAATKSETDESDAIESSSIAKSEDDNSGSFMKERSFGGSSSFSNSTSRASRIGGGEAIERVESFLRESLQVAPSTVIWIVDRSDDSKPFTEPLLEAVRGLYGRIESDAPKNTLRSAVIAADSEAETLFDASDDPAAFASALDSVEFSDKPEQNLFAAIQSGVESIGIEARKNRNQVFVICLTNEAPTDRAELDQTIHSLQNSGAPLYVIGIASPFGRVGNETTKMMRSNSDQGGLACGPESSHPQRIQLGFPSTAQPSQWLDSGFGEWSLERACRKSGGRFLVVRDIGSGQGSLAGGEWPKRSAPRFSDSVMAGYLPSYASEEQLAEEMSQSKLRQALIAASQLPYVEPIKSVTYRFDGREQTRLTNELTRAQREPARVIPPLERLVTTLQSGEIDRDKETDPRWQAAFDLALGRALAAHTRADGYNVLLAELKQGKNFSDDKNDSWVIQQADAFESGGSSLKNGAKKAQELLQRVIKEHPDTPWAYLAEQELSEPIAWVWTEEDRQ